MTDPSILTATEAARRLRDGNLTATALMEALLDRARAREPVLRAFVHLDPDAALAGARAADARAASGAPLGPLHGLPLGVKDVLDAAGMPAAYGSPIWAGHVPRADSAAVALARAAGAVVMGKTVTTEFATRQPGPTTHPANPAHTPGGSSSGSAAGVAAGLFPLAFGTQTAGSIIRPAAFCGIAGYMPTHGSIHRAGMKVMSESLDTIGALARTVADCALLVGALTGRELGDPGAWPDRPPRLLLCLGPHASLAAPETLALMERAERAARGAGAVVTRGEMPPAIAAAAEAHPVVMNGEIAQALAWELENHRDRLSPVLLEKTDAARALPARALDEAREVLAAARAAFPGAIADCDAVLTPSAPGEAPEGLGWTGDPGFNLLWTALHAPAVTVPAGTGPRGLPLGVQLVAAPGRDREALRWAEWVRQAMG
ncbi:amidase [Muricoccus pecuniae]|uniref:Asp-tRNA(Asn)/Glu-tRNA(Gln) amidotransferase A subunit family amidase n=1 Tax=Muricoccus pecuniae TaxID=693023 RepID=A0A840Y896_9PROT|nr:amidase [Roseomonas pecuniae]MBB5694979.1 Asp-tRNA(Asn)/Glu-tRNA(Gln) amidotransferase A subunit family amidase [Roseomonas pecuniae]